MHALRTRFASDIVTEFFPPKDITARDVVIFCDGMPSMPNKKRLLRFLHQKNFWAFHPRYRGTWESDGEFLSHDPTQDILDVIDGIHKPFVSLWDKQEYAFVPNRIILVGASFGGPAALFASRDPRVHSAIAVSPVVDWQEESDDEPLDWLYETTTQAFGNGYRMTKEHWQKLSTGEFYNPRAAQSTFDGSKVLIFHAKDDTVVQFEPVAQFAQAIGCAFVPLKRGGHLSSSILRNWRVMWKIRRFLARG